MKRFIGVLSILFVLFMATVSVAQTTVYVGETFYIDANVIVEKGEVDELNFNVKFDSTYIDYVGYHNCAFTNCTVTKIDSGTVRFEMTNDTNINVDIVPVKLEFKALQVGGTQPTTFSYSGVSGYVDGETIYNISKGNIVITIDIKNELQLQLLLGAPPE